MSSERLRSVDNSYKMVKNSIQQLEDAIINLSSLGNQVKNHQYGSKAYILQALANGDTLELRNISKFYYDLCGIYRSVTEYSAYLYRYDWYVVPEVYDSSVSEEKVLKEFSKILHFLDTSYI